jgi:hypothetical protein
MEYRLQPDDQLCFIHIMKTAGTTFTSIIDAHFPLKEIAPRPSYLHEVCPDAVNCDSPEAISALLTRYRFIRGHFGYAQIHGLLRQPLYTTMLRKPLERTISFYEFMRRSDSLPKREDGQQSYQILKTAAEGSLLDFITNPNPTVQRSIANHQTRKLAAIDEEAEVADAELIASAKANLDQFLFVGLTERFQDSVFLLSYIFGWYPTTEFQSLRVAKDKLLQEQLPPEMMEQFLQRNQLDLELYDYAAQLFEQRFTHMKTELCEKYHIVDFSDLQSDRLHQLLEEHYQQRYQERCLPSVKRLDLEFSQAIFGTGWQRRNGEHNGLKPNGPLFRWTGPGTVSTLDLALDTDSDLMIKLRIVAIAAPDIFESLQLFVGQDLIPLQTLHHENNLAVVQGTIPRTILAKSDRPFTRLTLTVNRTVPIQSLNQSKTDTRYVGLGISRIQLFPAHAQPERFDFAGQSYLPPAASDYLYLLFPAEDLIWAEVADFIWQRLQPHEEIAAPNHFIELFPQQFIPYTQNFTEHSALSWVVIHKGQLQHFNPDALTWTLQTLKPVFANSVFVVFTSRSEVPSMNRFSAHIRSLWQTWRELNGVPIPLWQRLNPKRWLRQ